MKFSLYNELCAYGDQFALNDHKNQYDILSNIDKFKNNWYKYNPRKNIERYALSIINLDGSFSQGPDLDSLYEYNKLNGTSYNELDFRCKTKAYESVESYVQGIEQHLGRSHILKLKPGGFFPNHVDHRGNQIWDFRLIIPLKNCNPIHGGYFIYERERILQWEEGRIYFLNTCKNHTVFNANPHEDLMMIIFNVELNDETVKYVTRKPI
tara:strand:+ start:43 stop:672 length:630 start_codon:yes stop_codon:yes gene_type:complete